MRRGLIAGYFLVGFCGILAAADPKVDAPAPDFSSPDKTWVALCAALKAGDSVGFRACFYCDTDIGRRYVAAYSEMTITWIRLAQSADLIMGVAGRQLRDQMMSAYTEMVASGKNRKTEIKEDAASWSRIDPHAAPSPTGNQEEVLYFKKVKGQWLIDTTLSYGLDGAAGRKKAEDFITSVGVEIPLMKKIIADIQANKIHSLEELRKRLAEGDGVVR